MKSNAKLHAFLNSLFEDELTGINRNRSNSEMNENHGYSRLYMLLDSGKDDEVENL